jgi:hypothetical protein
MWHFVEPPPPPRVSRIIWMTPVKTDQVQITNKIKVWSGTIKFDHISGWLALIIDTKAILIYFLPDYFVSLKSTNFRNHLK